MNITLRLSNGEEHSSFFEGSSVTIGRGNKADFCVPDASLSRLHCKIEIENGQYFVTDLGSTNGVFLDGVRIPSEQRVPFNTFLILMVSQMECVVSDSKPDIKPDSKPNSRPINVNENFDKTKVNTSIRSMNQAVPAAQRLTSKKHNPDKAISPGMLAIIGVCILAAIYYYAEEPAALPVPQTVPVVQVAPKAAPKVEPGPTPQVTPQPAQVIPSAINSENTNMPVFLGPEKYQDLGSKKSCKIHADICQEMKLSEVKGEGVTIEGKAVFIYLSPGHNLADYPTLKNKTDAMDVIALKAFFDTKLYVDFKSAFYEHVHLILQHPVRQTFKVIRLDSSTYKDDASIESTVRTTIATGNTAPLWELMQTRIKTKSF